MKKYFTVSEAAKEVGMTSETLRHYDRIGLVKPSKKDEWTNYRYYSMQDLILLNTVHALQQMDLPLKKIKEVLEYDNLEDIIRFLQDAEIRASEKISQLMNSKRLIQTARCDYERKLCNASSDIEGVIYFPERVILLSDSQGMPTLQDLWDYLRRFYEQVRNAPQFEFEDVAGVYTEGGISKQFAVCTKYSEVPELKTLPSGNYLCCVCTESELNEATFEISKRAKAEYDCVSDFIIQQVIVSGILQWKYQIQIYLGKNRA